MIILLGYVSVFSYVFFLIFLLGKWVQNHTNLETSRKIVHIMLFMVWVLIDVFFKNTIHQIVIPAVFLVLNALSFKLNIYKSVERTDNNHMGTVYFAAAILTVMAIAYFIPSFYLPSGVAAFCLTFGDGFAALIGYNFKSSQIKKGKSIAGLSACFTASALSLIVFKLIFWPDLSIITVLLLASVTAIAELTGSGLDNFTVTYSVFATSWLLTTFPNDGATQGVIWALAVFAVVFFSKAITYSGSMLSMLIVFVFRFCGGRSGLGYLLMCYFTIFAISIMRKKLFKVTKKENSRRNFLQIFINGSLGTACLIAYCITGYAIWLTVGIISVGGCFIDSVSSDIGSLSCAPPYDPIKRVYVPRGLSGGMTVLGTTSAVMCSLFIALFSVLIMDVSWTVAAIIGIMVLTQSLLDTLIGSIMQVKYRCSICGELTEKHTHCESTTIYESGFKWMNNNLVNMITSVAITAIAYAFIRLVI